MKAFITVMGHDTVGVVAKVSGLCSELNINIEDVTQSILQGMFAMIMLVDLSHCNVGHEELHRRTDALAAEMKMQIKEYLEGLGHEVVNYGVDTTESCNYPEIGERVGRAVADGEVECAVLICGTGVGISIAANKVNGVRAAVCSDITTAHLVKEHNNANIIAFGARIVGIETAKDIVKAYLDAEFLGGRHQTRIDMISDIEKKNLA